MSKEKNIECSGVVQQSLRGAQFKVKLNGSDHVVIATISGKIRQNNIQIVPGDQVTMKMSPYDSSKAIICFRVRNSPPPA
ncbi:translation initiation factor IF-1 [Candidatus Hepatobacter penaei]|uniref:translation initiation factor IF-1 n=1 Tax=Candidatus Hepatobacter penaei TaxID=1274402 RepID=UPI0009E1F4D3|nr:translation initiation factor IF-1 [Candidatus Hepatobacter penaei]TGW14932.1 translation initiation factor IF-1 [bacterium NHP-B]